MARWLVSLIVVFACVLVCVPSALGGAPDDARREQGREMTRKAIAYLRSQQDAQSGGWGVPKPDQPRPVFPAITALAITGMLMEPGVEATDATVAKGVSFLLKHRQADGGIYDRILPSYNTAISLMALARVDTAEAQAAVRPAQDFLRGLQFSEAADTGKGGEEAPSRVERSHPFYGGIGYGRHGRPDLSNLAWMLEGLHASGVASDDPAFQRALVFLSRVQMLDRVNDMAYADGTSQGGFIYATGPSKDQAREGESKAGVIEETLSDGSVASRLRCYGSMTYAGFKSMIYAGLARDDERVKAARGWIGRNYTLKENPGIGTDGYYYYLVTFARALDAWGEPTLEVSRAKDGGSQDEPGTDARNWANDLIEQLATLQEPDGSFRSVDDRWLENDPVLITSYSLLALQHALKQAK